MEYEEWIKENVGDEEKRHYIHCKVAMNYFPFTKQCPVDGKRCKEEECKDYNDSRCLHFELNRLVFEVLGPGDTRFRIFEPSEDNYFHWIFSVGNYYPETKGGPERVGFSIYSENYTISEMVLKDAGLSEYFESDFHTTAYFPATFESLPTIQEFLELLKSLFSTIEGLFVKYHTCGKCNKLSYEITWFDTVGICEGCQHDIVREWILRR